MYSIREAADLLGVQPRTLRRCLLEGKVPGAVQVEGKHGPTWRIPTESLSALRKRAGQQVQQGSSEAEIVARHLGPPSEPVPALGHGAQGGPQAPSSVVPWATLQDLLRAEHARTEAAQRLAESHASTVAMLRQALEQERDEVLRLRCEVLELRQQLDEARGGRPVLRRRGPRLLQAVDDDRETQPLDLDALRELVKTSNG